MRDRGMGWVLRVDALFDGAMGLLLLLAPYHEMFDDIDLPDARPEIFTQMLGGLLIGYALLLWEAPNNHFMTHAVARATVLANLAGVAVIVGWLLEGDLGIETGGKALLGALAGVLALLAALEAALVAPHTHEE